MLALQVAVNAALADEDGTLANARRRFDIFYSRVTVTSESRQFAELRSQDGADEALIAMNAFLDRQVTRFDASDAVLRAALPDIVQDLEDLRDQVRTFSLLGVKLFALAKDERREALALLLTRLGILTFALVFTLLLVVLVLLWMIRRSARAEIAVENARNRLQEVISTSIDGILAMNLQGQVVDYNGAAERIFGYTRDEAIGQDMADLIIPDHLRNSHNAGMKRFRLTGENHVVGAGLLQLEAKRKDGAVFPVEVTIASVDADGEQIFVSFLRDVSARAAVEKELVVARDKAVAGEKAKAELLAVMSHEMRTPLNGLLGTMVLMQETRLAPKQKKYLSAMETSASLLLSHVNNVLSISGAEAGQLDLKPIEIRPDELFRQLVASQQSSISANGNAITVSTGQGPEIVWADRTRLLQVLLNLLGNANKFTRNGQLVLECDSVPDSDMVEFRVIDDGIGIAKEDQSRIWEDFQMLDASYSRVTEGSGLGLAISKRLVIAMGGEIGVESETGKGSLFWVRLPVGTPVEKTTVTDNTKTPIHPTETTDGTLDILLVEDNMINRLVARDILEKAGHRVVEAEDGHDGIKAAATELFDIILMDISMPVIDGVTATHQIRETEGPNRSTPIIALTAHALAEDLVRFRKAGVTDTIVKPLTKNTLLRSVGDIGPIDRTGRIAAAEDVFSVLRAQIGIPKTFALIAQFIAETDRLASRCSDAVGSPAEAHELADQAHNAAGSAAVFQLKALGLSLADLETALRSDRRPNLHAAMVSFTKTWSQARPGLLLHSQGLSD
nr:PAS domain-containing hybrid sensor histidine kinase/response regulator [Loktanella sp. SALINAS62]